LWQLRHNTEKEPQNEIGIASPDDEHYRFRMLDLKEFCKKKQGPNFLGFGEFSSRVVAKKLGNRIASIGPADAGLIRPRPPSSCPRLPISKTSATTLFSLELSFFLYATLP
jgi:hypothetical protein